MVLLPPSALASITAARSVQTPFPAAVSQTPFPGFASTASTTLLTLKLAAYTGGCERIPAEIRPSRHNSETTTRRCLDIEGLFRAEAKQADSGSSALASAV